MKRLRILLMLAMLFIGIGGYAQTVVEFVAGVDKGSTSDINSAYVGYDEVKKNGVTMSCSHAAFGGSRYSVKKVYAVWGGFVFGGTLSFQSEKKDIASIQFVDGDNLSTFTCGGYDYTTGMWTGRSKSVNMSIGSQASFSKVIITLYDRPLTSLSMAETVAYNYIEQQLNTPVTTTLKCGDDVLRGLPISYESSNTSVADVLVDNGVACVVPKAEGTTVITAKFLGNAKYDYSNEAKMTVNVVNGMNIFHETFSNLDGIGGTDGNYDYTDWNNKLDVDRCDNPGWSAGGVAFLAAWAYNASRCVRVETGASITTPALSNLTGDAVFMFRAAQNRNVQTTVSLSVSGGGTIEQKSVTLSGQEFADYVVFVKDATPQTRIKLSCNIGGSFYLDDVKVERAVMLDAAADNTQTIQDNASMIDGATVNVMLKRNLSSKCWNTVCLPFSVKKEQMAEVFGENTYVVALDRYDAAENAICFKQTDEVVAGTPCLVWPGEDKQYIMIKDAVLTDKLHNVMSNGVNFKGVYSPTTISYNDVYLDPDSELDAPDEVEGSNRISGFNAYFSGLTDVSSARVSIDGVFNSISGVTVSPQPSANRVYTIDGRFAGATLNNLSKGVYIVGGKKVVK